MRDYGKVASTFWTGSTGRAMRSDREAQVVAMYLITGPMANMIGLYHLPVALLSDHTGIPLKGASKALRRVCDTGFSHFDGALEHVFVPEMAAFQVGEPLKREDKRVAGIISQWQSFRKSSFYLDFYTRYAISFHLPEPRPLEGASGRDARAGSQDQDQDQKQETDPANAGGMVGFEEFWKAYPRKVAKPAAAKAWRRVGAEAELLGRILADIRGRIGSAAWTKDDGQFIPHPATYLNARRWEDEPVGSVVDPEVAARYAARHAEDD